MSDTHDAPGAPKPSDAATDAAVQATMAAPAAAPMAASDVSHTLNTFGARLAQIEGILGLTLPVINEAGAIAGAFVPAAAPVLERLPQIEGAVEGILSALAGAFGEKLGAPPPGTLSSPPPAAPPPAGT